MTSDQCTEYASHHTKEKRRDAKILFLNRHTEIHQKSVLGERERSKERPNMNPKKEKKEKKEKKRELQDNIDPP